MSNLSHCLWSVPHEEAVAVEPVSLLAVKEGALDHGGQPEVALGDVRLAGLALGPPGLGPPGLNPPAWPIWSLPKVSLTAPRPA